MIVIDVDKPIPAGCGRRFRKRPICRFICFLNRQAANSSASRRFRSATDNGMYHAYDFILLIDIAGCN